MWSQSTRAAMASTMGTARGTTQGSWRPRARSSDSTYSDQPPGGPIRRTKCGHIPTTDQSGACRAGIFPQRTNQTQEAWVIAQAPPPRGSPDGPIRRTTRGNIPTTDQSDTCRAGIFPQRTNQTQEARVYAHNGLIRRRKRG
eukprot:6436576-Pyramimonas_sp.AAC.1